MAKLVNKYTVGAGILALAVAGVGAAVYFCGDDESPKDQKQIGTVKTDDSDDDEAEDDGEDESEE